MNYNMYVEKKEEIWAEQCHSFPARSNFRNPHISKQKII